MFEKDLLMTSDLIFFSTMIEHNNYWMRNYAWLSRYLIDGWLLFHFKCIINIDGVITDISLRLFVCRWRFFFSFFFQVLCRKVRQEIMDSLIIQLSWSFLLEIMFDRGISIVYIFNKISCWINNNCLFVLFHRETLWFTCVSKFLGCSILKWKIIIDKKLSHCLFSLNSKLLICIIIY